MRSRKKSEESEARLVRPQARFAVCPITMPGIPAKPKPATSNGQSPSTVRQCSPCWYQIPGTEGARCGSLASSGIPVAVCSPETTQEFDPTPSPPPIGAGTARSTVRADSIEARALAEEAAPSSRPGAGPAPEVGPPPKEAASSSAPPAEIGRAHV